MQDKGCKTQGKRHLNDIIEVFKKTKQSTEKYSTKIFANEQVAINEFVKRYIEQLNDIKQVKVQFDLSALYQQLKGKYELITKLCFPSIPCPKQMNHVKFKSVRFQKLIKGLTSGTCHQDVIISYDNIRRLIGQEYGGKLNHSPQLFSFDNYLINKSRKYPYDQYGPALRVQQQKMIGKPALILKVISGYYDKEAAEVISSNMSSVAHYKGIYQSAINSQQYKNIDSFNSIEPIGLNKFMKYLRMSMNLQFINNLVQPQQLQHYLSYFSIIQNQQLCSGLILGKLQKLIKEIPEESFSDSDEEMNYQNAVDQLLEQFCLLFQGYCDSGCPEVKSICKNILNMKKNSKYRQQSLKQIIQEQWQKEEE